MRDVPTNDIGTQAIGISLKCEMFVDRHEDITIFDFLMDCYCSTDRTQAVKAMGLLTVFLAITRSIVQGSKLRPMLSIAPARKPNDTVRHRAVELYYYYY